MISRKLLLGMTLAGAMIAGCAATDYDQGKYDSDAAAAEPAPLPPRNPNVNSSSPINERTAIPSEGNAAPRGQLPPAGAPASPHTGTGTSTGTTTTNP